VKRLTALLALCAALHPFTARAEGLADHVKRIDPPHILPPLVFEDERGNQHALSDYHGRYVLLNIWASWCTPCVAEMPSLDALQGKIDKNKLTVLPVSEERGDQSADVFYSQHKIKRLPVAYDHAGTAPSALHLHGIPTTILIDPQGREIARVEGDIDWSADETLTFLNAQMR
jgi:thiol-disulfide isomerase/thioredoxin